MPRQKQDKPLWELALQVGVKEGRRGWSVVNFRGKTRLRLQFPKQQDKWPADQQAFLPYAWEPASVNPVLQLINHVYGPVMEQNVPLKRAIDDVLATSNKKADLVVTPWPSIIAAFKENKLTQGNRITESTFDSSYGRYLKVALKHLQGRKTAQTGKELTERVLVEKRTNQKPGKAFGKQLTPWIEMPKSRLECCLAIKKFTEFAVLEHRQPQSFLIDEKDYLLLRGSDGKRRTKAVLTDNQILELIQQLPEHWGNVVKVSRVFGVRPWEIAFIRRQDNPGNEKQLWVSKGKVYNTRGGVKETTEPRWLEAVPVNGQTFGLVEGWDILSLPDQVSGKTLGAILRRLPYWQHLKAEFDSKGEWLRPYSFRDTFSVRAHSFNISDTDIAAAMGHTVEVHHRSYRTSEWKGVRRAFAQAS